MGIMMKSQKRGKVILIPYPAQGHVTPMFKLAFDILNHGGFDPVVLMSEFLYNRIISDNCEKGIPCMSIPDGLEKDATQDFFSIEKAMEDYMPTHLERIINNYNKSNDDVVCIVVDLVASWAIEVANRCGIPVAGFWPAMLATYSLISAIPDFIKSGFISPDTGCPNTEYSSQIYLPNQPVFSSEDLPWLIGTPAARKSRFRFWVRILERSKSLRWLLVNSFPDEHYFSDEIIVHSNNNQTIRLSPLHHHHHHQDLEIFPIGPLISSKQHSSITKEIRNPSFWEEDTSCLEWLDKQNPNSVMYISFGSWVSPIGEEDNVKTLALTLEKLRVPFIWVLGFGWRDGLPDSYLKRVVLQSKNPQGKIVSWAPQVKVLQHVAVGCYLTHCGWNSTVEAVQCRKRMICYPIAGDQFVNCSYIVDIWKVGVRIRGFEEKDVRESLRKVMVEEGNEMDVRLGRLCEGTMGMEAKSRAIVNLSAFFDELEDDQMNMNDTHGNIPKKNVGDQYLLNL